MSPSRYGSAPVAGLRITQESHAANHRGGCRRKSPEKTIVDLSRERARHHTERPPRLEALAEVGPTTAVQASEDVVPASQLHEFYAKIQELEQA